MASAPAIEGLEGRVLMSVSVTTLIGPRNDGTTWKYELIEANGTVVETNTETLVGPATFNGQSATEVDSTGVTTGGTPTTTTKSYGAVTSDGLVGYGSTAVVTDGAIISDISTTFSPTEITLPATMVAGTPYTETTTSTAVTTGATSATDVIQESTTLTLEAATKPVSVPAGNYPSAFVIDETITTTSTNTISGLPPITGNPITNALTAYYVKDVGLVQLGPAAGGGTELVTFTKGSGGGGGGGGGGSGTPTGLTPAIVSSTVPSAIVGGAKLHAALKVSLTDSGTANETGVTVKVFASTNPTFDASSDTLVTTLPKTFTVKAGKSASLNIPILGLPSSLPDGSYYLFVETVDTSSNILSAATTSPVVVAAPFVTLSETVTDTLPAALVSGSTAKGTVTVTITNSAGNVPSKGLTAINITASTVSGVLGTSIITPFSKMLNIPVGKSAKVTVPIKNTPAGLSGDYFIVDQVTDPITGAISLGSSAGTTNIAAAFIKLAATLGAVTKLKSGDTVTITNNGNHDDVTTLTGTIGFSTDAAGQVPTGRTASESHPYTIKVGKSIKIHSTGWSTIAAGLTHGVSYYLTLTGTDSGGNLVSAVSPNTFTF